MVNAKQFALYSNSYRSELIGSGKENGISWSLDSKSCPLFSGPSHLTTDGTVVIFKSTDGKEEIHKTTKVFRTAQAGAEYVSSMLASK